MKDYNKEPNYIHSCDSKMLDEVYREVFMLGYEQAEKDILALIESRLSEIIGDAQPKPALRAELIELITDMFYELYRNPSPEDEGSVGI